MRTFGSDVGDLDLDFTARAPFLVTDLLRRCASLTEEDAWSLPVGARIEALVDLTILSASRPLAIGLRCPRVECHETQEIELEAGELRAACADGERDFGSVHIGERRVHLRRPTGRDQREWLGTHWPDLEAARTGMLACLLDAPASEPLDASILPTLEAELSSIDPLVDFTLQVACPACGRTSKHTIDLEQHALAALRRIHERLFESVASLATRFHWTEAEIFALPSWRRDRYLAWTDAHQ